MSNLSPAAIALEADLYLLTRLPLPKEADLDAIKERVFGSESGVPRTEDESRRRYVDAIVEAFDVVGVYRISDFPKEVKNLLHKYNLANIKHSQVSAQLKAAQGTLDDMHEQRNDAQRLSAALEKENAAFRKAVEDRLKEQGEAPTNVNRDFILARRRANDLEAEVNHLRTENAKLRDSAHALTTERDRLAARVREHEETLAVLSNVNADLFKAQQELREARDESKRWHDYSVSLNAKWEKTEQERDALKACRATDQDVLAEKDRRIGTLAKQIDGLTYERDKAVTELEDMRDRESVARADAVQCHHEMRVLRTDLTTAQKHQTDLTAALTRALNRVQELHAETVEQENSYNHLALVVVDLLKGRGVE